jgi:hypothetical protein
MHDIPEQIISFSGPNTNSKSDVVKKEILKKAAKMIILEWKKCCNVIRVYNQFVCNFLDFIISVNTLLSLCAFTYCYVTINVRMCSHSLLMFIIPV